MTPKTLPQLLTTDLLLWLFHGRNKIVSIKKKFLVFLELLYSVLFYMLVSGKILPKNDHMHIYVHSPATWELSWSQNLILL